MKCFSARNLIIAGLMIYQKTVSPWFPRACRFFPTCSQYSIEALRMHGLLKGLLLTTWRLLRCQPFCRGGFDPVPGIGVNKDLKKK